MNQLIEESAEIEMHRAAVARLLVGSPYEVAKAKVGPDGGVKIVLTLKEK